MAKNTTGPTAAATLVPRNGACATSPRQQAEANRGSGQPRKGKCDQQDDPGQRERLTRGQTKVVQGGKAGQHLSGDPRVAENLARTRIRQSHRAGKHRSQRGDT